ncbi:hypothetical protein AV654_06435 [Paenibacillus elgii]|uniref:Uncharacterized protein n=1 Tax=Paenibacillus elgii TaxID=189691 RepID=A0A165PF29_9BACL|nr:hypothetical protein [Paenibacillus elgii]KZE70517.1 hypothetical protein AV654_06435 [Paenibacillus elgii]
MKKWTGKVMVGTVAAAVLFGGIGGLTTAPKAFADDDVTYTVVPDVSVPLHKRVDLGLNSIVVQASGIINMSVDDFNAELKKGKSISELARTSGVERSELISRLVNPALERIDNAVSQNRITEEEATQLKSEVTEKFSAAVDKSGYQDKFSGKYSKKLKLKTQVDEESVAKVLGITQNELDEAFSSGKTIADIAKEKGLKEDQVIAGLKDELNASLKEFINKK